LSAWTFCNKIIKFTDSAYQNPSPS
jgi:hypothetical protein